MRGISTLALTTMGATLLWACGGEPSPPAGPQPPAGVVSYQQAPYVVARILSPNDLDRSLLTPGGDVTTVEGRTVPAYACPEVGAGRCDAAEWEIVLEGEAGWQVWEPAAVAEARADLAAALGVPEASIDIVQVAAVDWPDACLGLPAPGEACAEVITPGFLVRLQAQGVAYEYHTDLAGEALRRAGAPGPPPTPDAGGPKLNRDAAVEAAVADLARRLGVSAQDIALAGAELRQWADACLGLPAPGELCAQVITPGFAITLQFADASYRYRTNADGSAVRPEP